MLKSMFAAAVLLCGSMACAQTINAFAGGGASLGDGGPASAAQLAAPQGVAVDASGNVFIADNTHFRIRRVDGATGIITTIAGTGTFGYSGDGGPGTAAMISGTIGIAVDGVGNVYFCDFSNNRIRRIDRNTGIITTVAGNGLFGYTGDGGPATSARLALPQGVAIAPDGDIYIADTQNFALRRVDAVTGIITSLSDVFLDPRRVAVDAAENVYVMDRSSSSRIHRYSTATSTWSIVAGGGGGSGASGSPNTANLGVARDIAVDGQGRLLIAGTRRVWRADLALDEISFFAGTGAEGDDGDGGPALDATFVLLGGVGSGPDGAVYISDSGLGVNRIRRVAPPPPPPPPLIINAFAGGGASLGDGGPASAAQLAAPQGVAVDASGNVFIVDNTHFRIRRVDAATGIITTIAGTGSLGYSGDGGPGTAAQIAASLGIAVDSAGNVFFCDASNHRIRRIDRNTGIITTVAGNGLIGYTGDGGPATSARLAVPEGVAVAPDGDIYIADTSNFALRRVDAVTGIITSLSDVFIDPRRVAVDAAENVYVLDRTGNSRIHRYNTATSTWSIVAGGGGGSGASGSPNTANLGFAVDVAVDGQGRLLIGGAHRVWRADLALGEISFFAGTGAIGNTGDGGPALDATFTQLGGVGVGPDGAVYISDAGLGVNRIRRVALPAEPPPPGPEITVESFTSPRSTPVQLGPPSGAANDRYGGAVAIDGDTLVVGSDGDDVGANANQGSAHVYRWTGSGWVHEAVLTAADGAADDNFGSSVAIDGDTIVVGAPGDDTGGVNNHGSAYIFTRMGTTWTQQARVIAEDGAAQDAFGRAVSIWADTVVVGALLADIGGNSDQGAAYVFTRTGTSWSQQAKLEAAAGAEDDRFGNAVAVWGDWAVVGAALDDVGAATDRGSVHVFARNGSSWSQQAHLTAFDGAAADLFGQSVSIWGDTLAVGAPGGDIGANANQGSVYVYVRTGAAWNPQAKVTASPGTANANLGHSVALHGDTLAAGAWLETIDGASNRGAMYIFARSGAAWMQQARLAAPDGTAMDQFGAAVALWGDTAVGGAPFDDVEGNTDQGSAWVFSRLGTKWIGPDLMLLASDGAANDEFGTVVAIDGDTIVVGSPRSDVGGDLDRGAAYVFVRSGLSWVQQAKLTAADGAASDRFGAAVAIKGDTIVVGAPNHDVDAFTDTGAAYVFVRSSATWTQQAKLTTSTGVGLQASQRFGSAVALVSESIAFIGAPGRTVGDAFARGLAFRYTRSGSTWSQASFGPFDCGDCFGYGYGGRIIASANRVVVVTVPQFTGSNGEVYALVPGQFGGWESDGRIGTGVPGQDDNFAFSVALQGTTVLVGAPGKSMQGLLNVGLVYVFERTSGGWVEQAQLVAPDARVNGFFGRSVALDGDRAYIGALNDTESTLSNRGLVYVFSRNGTTWTEQGKLVVADAAAQDQLAWSLAAAEGTVFAGAYLDDVGSNSNQGSVRLFEVPRDGLAFAANNSLGTAHASLAAALLGAQSGHQITATQQAWADIGSLDTLGRSLGLNSTGDLRTPSTSILTLGGSSFLAAAPGQSLDIFGQVRSSAGSSVDLIGEMFSLGSRGTLTARINSSLTINAAEVCFDGPVRVEQGAALNLIGGSGATVIAPTTFLSNSSMIADGPFVNLDTFNMSGGGLAAPLFWNRSAVNIFGSTAQFGDYRNESGATTTIRSGTLYIFGTLVNNGTIIGPVCSGCLGGPPAVEVSGNLIIGPDADLRMTADDAAVLVGGNFDCAINSHTRFNLAAATLRMEGPGGERTLEVMSRDMGPVASGLDSAVAGQYPLGQLVIGPAPTIVRLVDQHDNDNLGQGACEAVYVDTLRIHAGSRLINPACKVYYNTLINHGVVDVPGNLVQIAPPCPADFDGDGVVGVPDIFAFLAAWFAYEPRADFDNNGVLAVPDIFAFLSAWFAGCP
ncbi:MAG: hypothetical protein KF699_12080 [Phycisphaeraceae bacterium]|nr:hypothetical protein [Phycisphaeraceae bacterium]